MGFNSNMHAHIICVPHVHEKKSAKHFMQAYVSGIFADKGGSIAILSENGTEVKTLHSVRNVTNSASKEYFQMHFIPRANQESKTYTISIRKH